MKVTFLGTGTSQGVPVIACNCEVCLSTDHRDKRLRSSILIESKGKTFIIDTGPDFRQQMLRENVAQLDAVIFTHEHIDHIAGLDDIRAFNFKQRKAMDIYAEERVQKSIRRVYNYVFAKDKYPGIPAMNLYDIKNEPFEIDGVKFIPIRTMHHKLPVLAFRINDFTYVTDTNFISPSEIEKIKGSKVLVVGALHKNIHISHYNLSESLRLIEEIKPEKAYLTHISHSMGTQAAVEKELPENVFFAWDGLVLSI